jgi:hypothetical protein
MADLGTAVVAVAGGAVGGAVSALSAWIQTRSQERTHAEQLVHARNMANDEQAAAAAESRAERERGLLIAISDRLAEHARALDHGAAGQSDTRDWMLLDIQRLASLTGDAPLYSAAQSVYLLNPHRPELQRLVRRIGYLMSTAPDDRTDDGHLVAPPSE